MIRTLLKKPDVLLAERSLDVTDFGASLQELIDDLIDTLEANKAAGIAAIQVGVPQRVFIIAAEPGYRHQVFVNPRLLKHSGRLLIMNEGCLSVDEPHGPVHRPSQIEAIWQGREGKRQQGRFINVRARAFLHELDHLNGALYTDRLRPGFAVNGAAG